MKHAVLGCWVLVCAVLCGVLVCSERTSARSQDKLEVWLRAIDKHQPAAFDEHVRAIATWTEADLNAVLALAHRADVSALETRLKRAAWFHADVAILHRTSAGYGVAATGAAATGVGDGQVTGAYRRTPHWAFARQLLQESYRLARANYRRLTGRDPPPDDDVRLWHRATAAFLQSWAEYVELVPHLTNALAAFPEDPTLLLIKGSMHEYFAEAAIQVAVEQQRRLKLDVASVGPIRFEREDALRALDAAVRVDPTMTEARIRRANVLLRLGRYREAVDTVTPLLNASPNGALGYWLHLTHGRALLALDQLTGARSAFAAAMAMYPDAQTPRLALAQVAMRLGDVADPEVLTLRPTHTDDPWFQYHENHVPHANEWVERLRARWPR